MLDATEACRKDHSRLSCQITVSLALDGIVPHAYGLEPTLLPVLGVQTLGGEFGAEAAFDALDCSTLANGDADVSKPTAQLVLPCLSETKILAPITGERMSITPDAPALGGTCASLGQHTVERAVRTQRHAAGRVRQNRRRCPSGCGQ